MGEAVRRMRDNEIDVLPGYDGEYGQVKIFKKNERERLMGQKALFSMPAANLIQSECNGPSVSTSPNRSQVRLFKNLKKSEVDPLKEQKQLIDFNRLNRQQREAVKYPGGPLLIIAGPGTGKTRTLTQRIAYLIMEKGIQPQQILAVTFTNKAAEEMRERLNVLLADSPSLPLIATFHSLCFKILNEQKYKPIGILDDDQRSVMISEALKRFEATGEHISIKPQELLQHIIAAKQQILSPDEFERLNCNDPENRKLSQIYRIYQRLLSIQGFCDYEDLLFNVVRLFESKSNQCLRYRRKFQHIFVDEYQDLNLAQYRIIRALAPNNHAVKDICVIGDPDQAIYGFRGSDIKYFKSFISDYPDTKVIRLNRNYRSTQTILDASFQVIQDHTHQSTNFRVYSQKAGTKSISILELATEKEEADAIAKIIERQIGGTGYHSIDTGIVEDANPAKSFSYSDFAVLYRTNDQHRVIAGVFERTGVPYQIVNRDNALNQAGLPEIVALLKVIEEKGVFLDCENSIRLIISGIGSKTLDYFKDWCYQNGFSLREGMSKASRFPIPGLHSSKQHQLNEYSSEISRLKADMLQMTVAEKLLYLEKNTRLSSLLKKDDQAREKFANLVEFARQFDLDTTEFFTAAALYADTDSYTPRVEKVSLMTMHAAKGLEFPVVFVTGCEEDFIPFKRGETNPVDTEEERRLFYVAMTRAMERLYLTRAQKRRIYGSIKERVLSPFVADIEARLKRDETPSKNKRNKKQQQVQLKLFS